MTISDFIVAVAVSASLSSSCSADTNRVDKERKVPDQSIESAIEHELGSRLWVDVSDIDARVMFGEVTLRGTLPKYTDRMRIERVIADIHGVRRVNNWLRVESVPILPQHIEDRQVDDSTVRRSTNTMRAAKTTIVQGTIETKVDDIVIIRDSRTEHTEATLKDSTTVTLDGDPVDESVLDEGQVVFVKAVVRDGKLIAKSVEAHTL